MAKYGMAFGLSYAGALLLFAALGTVSLFRWPLGTVPVGFRLMWTVLPLAAACLFGRLFAGRWRDAAGVLSQKELLILFAVMAGLFLLSWLWEALRPLTAPGQSLSDLFGVPARTVGAFLLGLAGNLLYPLLFHLGWQP